MGQTKLCWGGLVLLSSSCQLLYHPHDWNLSSGCKSFSSFNIVCKAVPLVWRLFYFKEAPFILLFIFSLFWSVSFLESIPDQLSGSSTDQLLKASLVLRCQVLISSMSCHCRSLVARKAHSQYITSHRRENSSFFRRLRQREAEHRKALLSCFFKSRAWVIFNSNSYLILTSFC